mmetsp:Transcript_113860/g.327183  ORF Transcript_113860/g.327183 Transcript_113860/m.327183 type:complete len:234 (-) Transcript_113860:157-858(-)
MLPELARLEYTRLRLRVDTDEPPQTEAPALRHARGLSPSDHGGQVAVQQVVARNQIRVGLQDVLLQVGDEVRLRAKPERLGVDACCRGGVLLGTHDPDSAMDGLFGAMLPEDRRHGDDAGAFALNEVQCENAQRRQTDPVALRGMPDDSGDMAIQLEAGGALSDFGVARLVTATNDLHPATAAHALVHQEAQAEGHVRLEDRGLPHFPAAEADAPLQRGLASGDEPLAREADA